VCARPVEGLVAALVEQPAVVVDAEGQAGQREPLDDEERPEDAPRLVPDDQRPERPRALTNRHGRAPGPGTTRWFVRALRATASSPRIRTTPLPARRRGCAVVGRS